MEIFHSYVSSPEGIGFLEVMFFKLNCGSGQFEGSQDRVEALSVI